MIGKLSLKNFKTYRDSTLEFSPGINVITGDTGQGKTNILLALQLVKDNRPLGTGYIRRGQDSTEVVTEVIDNGNACSVIRRRGASENSYDIKRDGMSVVGKPLTAFGVSPPELVSAVLNLSSINVQKQRDPHFLVYSPPGQIATYIRSITKLDEIDQVIKLLIGKIRVKKGEISHQQEELKSTIEQLAILNRIDLELLGSMIEDAKSSMWEITQIKERIARVGPITSALRTLEEQWITIPDGVDKIFEDIERKYAVVVKVSSRLAALTGLIDEIRKTEACRITLPDGVDKILEDIEHKHANVVMTLTRLIVLTGLVDEIRKTEACKVTLPENLEILDTAKDASEKYTATCKKMEVLRELLKGIRTADSKIEDGIEQLVQLRDEETDLMGELSSCPECGSVLTEESKEILLER